MTPPPDGMTPDEIEQRQRPDGTVEADRPRRRGGDEAPRSTDEIEQRQSATTGDDEPDDVDVDGPLSPDVLEQRQAVAGDEDEYPAEDT